MSSSELTALNISKSCISSRPSVRTRMHLVMIQDIKIVPESRRLLVEWCRKMRRRGGMAFVSGSHARVVSRLSSGLQPDIYNSGMREVIPLTELLGWFPWQSLVIIQEGYGWELPLSADLQPIQSSARKARFVSADGLGTMIYERLGLRYSDK